MTTATMTDNATKFSDRINRMLGARDYRNFATMQRAYSKRYSSDNVTLPTFINRMRAAGFDTRVQMV